MIAFIRTNDTENLEWLRPFQRPRVLFLQLLENRVTSAKPIIVRFPIPASTRRSCRDRSGTRSNATLNENARKRQPGRERRHC
jgi:hypothetical protein